MNTSEKGSKYENAFKRHLLDTRRAYEVMRAAASKGRWDLIAIESDAVCAYQMKAGRMSCKAAKALAATLMAQTGTWPSFLAYVVHKTKEREFCEH